jgi:hypothetical protein
VGGGGLAERAATAVALAQGHFVLAFLSP